MDRLHLKRKKARLKGRRLFAVFPLENHELRRSAAERLYSPWREGRKEGGRGNGVMTYSIVSWIEVLWDRGICGTKCALLFTF